MKKSIYKEVASCYSSLGLDTSFVSLVVCVVVFCLFKQQEFFVCQRCHLCNITFILFECNDVVNLLAPFKWRKKSIQMLPLYSKPYSCSRLHFWSILD